MTARSLNTIISSTCRWHSESVLHVDPRTENGDVFAAEEIILIRIEKDVNRFWEQGSLEVIRAGPVRHGRLWRLTQDPFV